MKEFILLNQEPNCNLLGLDPIIRAFPSRQMKKLTGFNADFYYELQGSLMRCFINKKEINTWSYLLLKRFVEDYKFENFVYEEIGKKAKIIYLTSHNLLKRLKEKDLSESESKKALSNLFNLFTEICVPGLIGPIIEFISGGISLGTSEIMSKKFSDSKERNEIGMILTSIFEENYDFLAEEELSEIVQAVYDQKKTIDEIKPELTEYVDHWGWLNYGYCGPALTLPEAVKQVKILLKLGNPLARIAKRKLELKENRLKQERMMKMFALSEQHIILAARHILNSKYLRGKVMALLDYTINKLLLPFIQKNGLSIKQVGVMTILEVEKFLQTGQHLEISVLNERLKYCLLISKKDGEEVLVGDKAKRWVKDNVIEEDNINLNLSEISAQVACPEPSGKVKGKVKIVNTPKEMQNFKEGEILISVATTPDIVPAMKKAGAIVTELGGLTCHAAIVSRELNKPCLIGAKKATKIFKDGELVEVNTDLGLVRKID